VNNIGICITPNPIFNHMFLLDDIESNLKAISVAGFKSIEISLRDISDINWDKFNYSLKKYRLKLVTIATGLVRKIDGITLMDSEKKGLAIERIEKMMNVLNKTGCTDKYILLGYIRGEVKKNDSSKQIKILRSSLYKLVELAKKYQVKLLLEIINHRETNFLNTIDEGVNFITQFKVNWLKLAIDSYHMNINELDLCKSIINAKDHIGYVHLSDDNRAYPGLGNLDFSKILGALKEIKYKGYLMFECKTTIDKYSEILRSYKNISSLAKELGYYD
jgi:5-keto-L-gluconate epimerase